MKVGAVISDLLLYSRIESAASGAGATLLRFDTPVGLPHDLDLVLVDWSARQPDWAGALGRVAAGRVILFGPHTDLAAHADARAAALGPMMARSRLISRLPELMEDPAQVGS